MNKNSLIYGFAVFSMFFGSGNLVFPLQIGQSAQNYWLIGFWGLFLSGVILPFLGLFVIKLYHGNYEKFFQEIGIVPGTLIALFTLSLLGSFGVVPRCITVAHAGIGYLFPEISLFSFSLIFCISCYISCIKDSWMISIIGKWMTPILLVFLALLIIIGIKFAPEVDYSTALPIDVFASSMLRGYQTMDLFAAFFFSAVIFKEIQKKMPKKSSDAEIMQAALAPSIIGALLLGVVYIGFVYLGAHYADITKNLAPEMILPKIAENVLGKYAAFMIAVIIIFSCITTAVALNNIYARYICKKLHLDDKKFPIILFLTTGISFLISLLDFKGIASFLAPALEVSYPSLILLTVFGIFLRKHRMPKLIGFYLVLILSIMYN